METSVICLACQSFRVPSLKCAAPLRLLFGLSPGECERAFTGMLQESAQILFFLFFLSDISCRSRVVCSSFGGEDGAQEPAPGLIWTVAYEGESAYSPRWCFTKSRYAKSSGKGWRRGIHYDEIPDPGLLPDFMYGNKRGSNLPKWIHLPQTPNEICSSSSLPVVGASPSIDVFVVPLELLSF